MNRWPWKQSEDRFGFPALVLCCTLCMALFLYFNWQRKEQSHFSEHQAILDTAYRASVQMYRLAMEGFYANVLNTPQSLAIIEQAVDAQEASRDLARGRLYRLLFGSYETMRRQNLLQLQFHLADGTSFLRFHQPERYGDQLFDARPGVRICNTEQRVVQGLENGKTGSGFRYIFPLHHNGRHLGSVEVGVTVKSILDALKELDSHREYAYVINKKLAEAYLFPEQQWLYSQAAIHPNYLIEDANAVLPNSPAPLSSEAKELNKQLRGRPEVQRAMQNGQPLTVSATLPDSPYTISLLPMHDVGQRLSGYLITYNRDPLVAKLQQEFLLLIGFGFAALALIFTLLWRLRMRTNALAASKQNLEATHAALAEGVYVQNFAGIITAVNPAACSLLGYTPEEMLGQEAHDMFHRDAVRGETPKTECPFYRHIHKGKPYDGEEFFQTKDGRMLIVEVASRPIFREGRVVSSVTAFHDITQRRSMEEHLRDNESIQRTLMESLPVGLVIVDAATRIIEQINPFAAALFGTAPDAIIGNICHHFLCPANKDCCPISDLGQIVDNSDRLMIGANGVHIPVLKTVRTINIKGQVKLLECFVDIRERKKAENALLAANKQLESAIERAKQLAKEAETANQAKSIFLANMSHEIRTPMNAVLGMLHLALRTEITAQQRDFLGKAEHAAKSLLCILNEILDFSKIEAGYLQLEKVEFDLHEVLDHLITVIVPRLQDKPIAFTVGVAPDVPILLRGDPLRLGQVLINLAGNAAKFTGQGEVLIQIRLETPVVDQRARLRFDIADTGIGLAPEHLENLFTPFTQADLSTTRQFGGTGLGLSISQRLVQQMGGEIGVESTLGRGSRFSFDALFDVGVAEAGAMNVAGSPQQRVLIVDAHAPTRKALHDYLQRLGMGAEEVVTCTEGCTLLQQANDQTPFDLLFIAGDTRVRFDADALTLLADLPANHAKPGLVWLAPLRYRNTLEDTGSSSTVTPLYKPVSFHALTAVLQEMDKELVQPLHRQAMTTAGNAAERSFTGGRVLLAEDNEFNRLVAVGILENAGLEVLLAGNGEEAVRLVAAEQVDLILMDIQMPVMDGIEATRTIRQMPGCASLPVIAMTAYATNEEKARALAAGMNAHVAKPIDLPKLFATLSRWLPPACNRVAPTPPATATILPTSDDTTDIEASPASCAPINPADILEEMDELLSALHLCKPKLCTASLGRLRRMGLPKSVLIAIDTIDGLIVHYAFSQAEEIAASARTTMLTMKEGL